MSHRSSVRCGGALLSVAAFAALAGCAGETDNTQPPTAPSFSQVDISEFSDVRATVDYSLHQISYPLDAYLMTDKDADLIDQAFHLEFKACVNENGGQYTVPTVPVSERAAMPERRYGLWDVDEAAAYGYALPPGEKYADPLSELSEADMLAADKCGTVKYLPLVTRDAMAADGQDAETYLASSIASTAFELAQSDARWQAADDEWYQCIEDAGFVADREALGPVVPADAEGALRAAVVEATCSDSTGRIQRLADIESQYQAALIADQQTALNSSLEKQQEIIEQARNIIGEHS